MFGRGTFTGYRNAPLIGESPRAGLYEYPIGSAARSAVRNVLSFVEPFSASLPWRVNLAVTILDYALADVWNQMGPGVGRGIFNAPGADWMELCNWGGDGTPTAVYHYSITDVTDTFSCGNFDNLAGYLHPVQNWHVGNNEFELWHHPYYDGEPNSYGGPLS